MRESCDAKRYVGQNAYASNHEWALLKYEPMDQRAKFYCKFCLELRTIPVKLIGQATAS